VPVICETGVVLTESFHYRPAFGRIRAGAVALLCLAGLVGLLVAGDWPSTLRSAGPLLFLAALVFALFWQPRILVEPHSVTVVNVFRTIEVPWPAVERIDTRFSVTLFTPAMRIPVWAAPSPGIRGAVAIERADLQNLTESAYGPGHSVRPGDSTSTASGQVAFVLRQRWEALRDAGHLDVRAGAPAEESAPKVTTHWATIWVLGALFALAAAGTLL
jgi:hypothetical protein